MITVIRVGSHNQHDGIFIFRTNKAKAAVFLRNLASRCYWTIADPCFYLSLLTFEMKALVPLGVLFYGEERSNCIVWNLGIEMNSETFYGETLHNLMPRNTIHFFGVLIKETF